MEIYCNNKYTRRGSKVLFFTKIIILDVLFHAANTYQVPNTNLTYTLAADVALLTRNIKIIGEDYPGWYSESFGARVLVSTFSANGMVYQGTVNMKTVHLLYFQSALSVSNHKIKGNK